jgi:hypothetical protein
MDAQPSHASNTPPISGAMAGAVAFNMIRVEKARRVSSGANKSRTMARVMTAPPQALTACKARSTISISIDDASAQPADVRKKMIRLKYSGARRP